jgi:predicted RNA-binding protein with PUA-like domain
VSPAKAGGPKAGGRWIVKTEPSSYSWADLLRDGRTVWDGVKNAQALIHLRAMREGDQMLVYHSGDEKALVGLARVARGPYPDPKLSDPKMVVVDLAAERTLVRPVTLAVIKASDQFAELALVRQGRLSVMPASGDQWKGLMKLAGERSG